MAAVNDTDAHQDGDEGEETQARDGQGRHGHNVAKLRSQKQYRIVLGFAIKPVDFIPVEVESRITISHGG
jgi:hypothetical protein